MADKSGWTQAKARPVDDGHQVLLFVITEKARLEIVAMDILEISPKSKDVLAKALVGDTLRQWVISVPLKDGSGKTTAVAVLESWLMKYGPPLKLLSD